MAHLGLQTFEPTCGPLIDLKVDHLLTQRFAPQNSKKTMSKTCRNPNVYSAFKQLHLHTSKAQRKAKPQKFHVWKHNSPFDFTWKLSSCPPLLSILCFPPSCLLNKITTEKTNNITTTRTTTTYQTKHTQTTTIKAASTTQHQQQL